MSEAAVKLRKITSQGEGTKTMLNMMRADMQRIFRGKGIYVIIGILLFFTMMHTIGLAAAGDTSLRYTGADMASYLLFITDNVLYFLPFVIIFIVLDDFSHGTIKNVLSNGFPRVQYYFSKLLLSFGFCILLFGVHLIGGTLVATIIHGFGRALDMDFVFNVLHPALGQLFILLAITCVGVFFAFVTKNSTIATTANLSFVLLPFLLINMLSGTHEIFARLMDFELVTNIRAFASITELSSGEIARIFLLAGGYMILSTIGGMFVFTKAEIK